MPGLWPGPVSNKLGAGGLGNYGDIIICWPGPGYLFSITPGCHVPDVARVFLLRQNLNSNQFIPSSLVGRVGWLPCPPLSLCQNWNESNRQRPFIVFFRARTILHLLKCASWFSCDLICTISGISCIIIILCISSITIAVVLINRRNSSSTMLMLESKPEPTEMASTERMWVFR